MVWNWLKYHCNKCSVVGKLDYVQHLQSLNSGTEVGWGAHKRSSGNKTADFEALIFGGFCLESEGGGFLSVPRREMPTTCFFFFPQVERAPKMEPLLLFKQQIKLHLRHERRCQSIAMVINSYLWQAVSDELFHILELFLATGMHQTLQIIQGLWKRRIYWYIWW